MSTYPLDAGAHAAGAARAAPAVPHTGGDRAVSSGLHDASRFEWTVSIPLPERRARELAYTIEVELEVPTNAVARRSPWEQIQTFTRLDEASRPVLSGRGAVSEAATL